MSDRPTPETDGFVPLRIHHPSLPSWDDYVLMSFARKLERERDEAREDARIYLEQVKAFEGIDAERIKFRDLSQELYNVAKSIKPFISYLSIPPSVYYKFKNIMIKAKGILK